MENKWNKFNVKERKSIILKVLLFICLLFVFSKWDTIEKFLSTIFK